MINDRKHRLLLKFVVGPVFGLFALALHSPAGAATDGATSFSFESFEALPDGTQQDALTKHLLEKHPIGSDASSAIDGIKRAGAACVEGDRHDYCIYRIGRDIPYVEWTVGIWTDNATILSIDAERTVRTVARQK